MKKSYLLVIVIFTIIFFLLSIALFLKIHLSTGSLVRLIFCNIGLISISILNIRNKSTFITTFTTVSIIYFLLDPFYSICSSLLKNKMTIFVDSSFLSTTEGFIFFTCLCYLFFSLFKKGGK